jgi:hypothetical protein
MKKTIALALLTFTVALSARAQWIVYDPTMNVQQILAQAQNIAKYIQMIQNQVQQIQTLTDQLNEFKHYEELFGDPKKVLVSTIAPLVSDLKRSELGESLGVIMQTADGAAALAYNANGLYHTIGATFQTPKGNTIARSKDDFRPFAAINAATANYQTVSTNTAARRTQLKTEIATTIEQLRSATTDAEVQKLSGVLTGLSAALASTEHETGEALANTLVQDIENRNDERKQAQALKEQQSAAFSEAIGNYGKTFHLLDAPTTFPK